MHPLDRHLPRQEKLCVHAKINAGGALDWFATAWLGEPYQEVVWTQ
jgi:hypothetical protein